MANGRTPERTMHWQHVCYEAAKRVDAMRNGSKDVYDDNVCALLEQRAQAEQEGYDDTAAYLQHIIDDLTA